MRSCTCSPRSAWGGFRRTTPALATFSRPCLKPWLWSSCSPPVATLPCTLWRCARGTGVVSGATRRCAPRSRCWRGAGFLSRCCCGSRGCTRRSMPCATACSTWCRLPPRQGSPRWTTSAGRGSRPCSRGCGIKMVRVLILVKQARREMTRLVHPRAVQPVRLGESVVDNRVIFSVLAFMLVYGGTVIGLSMLLLLTDLDPVTAFSAVLASVNCMGPGLGLVGTASNYAVLTDFQIWVCTLAMLLGRLEFLSVMALLTPAFWRR